MFKCIIFHSSAKSFVPLLHKFTIQKLDLFCLLFFWEAKSAQHSCVYTDLSIFWEDGKKMSCRKVGLNFADFSQFELRRYVMKGKSKGNIQEVIFIVHWSGSTHRLLLQALGQWRYERGQNVSVTKKQTSHPANSKAQQKRTIFIFVLCQVKLILFNTNLITKNNIS